MNKLFLNSRLELRLYSFANYKSRMIILFNINYFVVINARIFSNIFFHKFLKI